MKTAKEIFRENLDHPLDGWNEEDIVISAIQEYASLRCYDLLTQLGTIMYGNEEEKIKKIRYEWLKDNIT